MEPAAAYVVLGRGQVRPQKVARVLLEQPVAHPRLDGQKAHLHLVGFDGIPHQWYVDGPVRGEGRLERGVDGAREQHGDVHSHAEVLRRGALRAKCEQAEARKQEPKSFLHNG